jgi:hypothetical protein
MKQAASNRGLVNLRLRTKMNDVDEEKGIVTIAVNHIGIEDTQGDISDHGSFDKTINEFFLKRGKHLLDHDTSKLIGCPIEASEKDSNLVVVSKMNLNKQIGRETFEDYKLYAGEGKTLEHSVGVNAIRRDEKDPRHVKEWFLAEVSTLQTWGANPETFLIGLKADDDPATAKAKMEAATAMLQKALSMRYSDEKLKKYEMNLQTITKALMGEANIVTCPYCGESFNYDEQVEHTFSDEVLDQARMYMQWQIDNIVEEEIEKLEPDIQSEVISVLDAQKMRKLDLADKGLTDLLAYVRCPHCWARVYRSDINKIAQVVIDEKSAASPAVATKQEEIDKTDKSAEAPAEATPQAAEEKPMSFSQMLSDLV